MESRKRKPLSDITNAYNLIPTSTLRKLVAASSNPNSLSKPPISILKSNSSSTNQKLCSESSKRSNTSIGSSNVSARRNSGTVQFRTPPRAISSITSQGGTGSKDAAYNRRRTTEKSNKEREAEILIVSPTKRKDKGKAIAVPFSTSVPEKMKENRYEIYSSCSPLDRKKQKDKSNLSLFTGPVEILKESGNRILNSYSHSYGKTEKGKGILNSGCSMGKQEKIGKSIVDHSSCSLEKANDGRKGILMRSGSSAAKTKELGKEFVNPSSLLVERTKEKGESLNTFTSWQEKTMEKGKAILQPPDMVKITKLKGSSAAVGVNSRPLGRKSQRHNNDAGSSSCPPMTRIKNLQNDLDEAGDVKSSKSWTDPHPKSRKKRCSRDKSTSELPLDFIEQQRAYFKEVDEFELPEEEVSQDELD